MKDYSKIPYELKNCPQWICWSATPDAGSHSGIKKIPIDPKTGYNAKVNDSSTWTNFDTAVRKSSRYNGIAFVFTDSGFFGVDIDDMPDEVQTRSGIVKEFVDTLDSYSEYSQSHNGIHIICKGKLPEGSRRKDKIEMYDTGRYFIMTGDVYSDAPIRDCTEQVKILHEKYLQKRISKPKSYSDYHTTVTLTEAEIIEKAENAKNGDKFKKLMSGNFSDYPSRSEADFALCSILAFWTGCNPDLIDSIYRKSGLMRDKWERSQSGSTYGALTIVHAIESCNDVYKNQFIDSDKSFSVTIGKTSKPKIQKFYTNDDIGNSERFIDLYGENIRYNFVDKKWIFYSGVKWVTDFYGTVDKLATESVQKMSEELKIYLEKYGKDSDIYKAFEKHVKKSRSFISLKHIVEQSRSAVPIVPSQFDSERMLLNTSTGTIDLQNRVTKKHDKNDYITKICGVKLAETDDCPRWKSFLTEIFNGDENLIHYVQKAVGYTLTGSTVEECIFFLYGTGRNGKSTFLEVIREIFGDYAANIQPETIMMKKPGASAINSDIARLKGARLVTSAEPNEGVRLNEGLVKQLTGSDYITARRLYGEEFEFQPEFKLWIATNHKPVIRGTDVGIWRRIHLIPFTTVIPLESVDKHLREKLKAELPQIFRWCLEGCYMWQSEGLDLPESVVESVKEYQKEMDVISNFIEEKCVLSGMEKSSRLYSSYTDWASTNNEYTMSNTKFGREMAKKFQRVDMSDGRYYKGISLL